MLREDRFDQEESERVKGEGEIQRSQVWHHEAIMSRGDDRLTPLFEDVFTKGVELEAWREMFSRDSMGHGLIKRYIRG